MKAADLPPPFCPLEDWTTTSPYLSSAYRYRVLEVIVHSIWLADVATEDWMWDVQIVLEHVNENL